VEWAGITDDEWAAHPGSKRYAGTQTLSLQDTPPCVCVTCFTGAGGCLFRIRLAGKYTAAQWAELCVNHNPSMEDIHHTHAILYIVACLTGRAYRESVYRHPALQEPHAIRMACLTGRGAERYGFESCVRLLAEAVRSPLHYWLTTLCKMHKVYMTRGVSCREGLCI
jgi:hypothetical protein